jgi:lysophospholipase L1-like esterase
MKNFWNIELAKNFLVSFFAVIFTVVLLEVGLWIADRESPTGYEPDPTLHHVHTPDITIENKSPNDDYLPHDVYFNLAGLREDREIPTLKPDGEYRILIIGDSYIEGRQVVNEATVSQRLEVQLNQPDLFKDGESSVTVINAGVSAYGPSLEYLYLKNKGLSYDPDLIIQFFAFNDVTDDFGYRKTMDVDEAGLPLAVRTPVETGSNESFARKIINVSEVLTFLEERVRRKRVATVGLLDEYYFIRFTSIEQNALAIFRNDLTQAEIDAWDHTKRYMSATANLAAEHDIPFLLTAIPSPSQVGINQWSTGKLKWGLEADELTVSTAMQDQLGSWAIAEDVPFLDLLPAFQDHDDEKLFFDFDGHWNEAGHSLAADTLLQFLMEEDFR